MWLTNSLSCRSLGRSSFGAVPYSRRSRATRRSSSSRVGAPTASATDARSMPVRSGPVGRASSSRASCGRLSASALGPWSPWLSSSKMLSAWTKPWRTIPTAFSLVMWRGVKTAAAGEGTGPDGEVDRLERREQQLGARAREDGRVGERAEGEKRLPAVAELGLHAQALRPAPVAWHDGDPRLEQAQDVMLERNESPLAFVVEDDRLGLEVVVDLGLAGGGAQAACDEPLKRRGRRALARDVVGEAVVR